jgi:hypothetical protein
VVLSLTGFSAGRHHSRHGGGGGGCSSSRQDHDTSSSSGSGGGSYDDSNDDSYTSGGTSTSGGTTGGTHRRRPTHRPTPTPSAGGAGSPLVDGTAKLINCATAQKPYATVRVSNPNGRQAGFEVQVTFMADSTSMLTSQYARVSVPANGTKTVKVPFDKANIDLLDHCEADPDARPSG